MKKIAVCAVALSLLFSSCGYAKAATLSEMSYAQLQKLYTQLTKEIMSRPEWKKVEVPAGRWTVGEDIPAGVYSVSMAPGVIGGKFQVWGAAVKDYTTNGGLIYNQLVMEDSPLGKVVLQDGYVIETDQRTIFAPPMTLGF